MTMAGLGRVFQYCSTCCDVSSSHILSFVSFVIVGMPVIVIVITARDMSIMVTVGADDGKDVGISDGNVEGVNDGATEGVTEGG